MAQITLNSTGVASNGSLVLQSNGTTTAVTIDTSQRAAFVAGTAALPAITTTGDTNTGIFFPAADTIAFSEGGAESMRIDSSGNVGIGTTSPASKLESVGTITSTKSSTNQYLAYTMKNSTQNYSLYVDQDNTGTNSFSLFDTTSSQTALRYYPSTSGFWQFYTNNTEAARIDSSGNLGVGTSSPNSRLQVSNSTVSTNAIAQFTNGTTGTSAGNGLYVGIDSTNEATVFNFHNSPIKFGTNGTERARFNTTGALVFAGGTTSADGIGITFPATQSASSNANTLDDYEEGTFTPVMNFGGAAAFSSGTAQGKYTKIGNVVNFQINFTGYVKTVNTGTSQITGMPFSASDLQKIYMVQGDSLTYTSGAFLFCFNTGAGATLDPYQQAAGTASQFTNSSFTNGGTFRVAGSYFIS